jgi:hypothetical protein
MLLLLLPRSCPVDNFMLLLLRLPPHSFILSISSLSSE